MKELYTIYVEGVADVRFLSQYIHHLFGVVVPNERIVKLDGWTNLKGTAWQQRMRAITDKGGTNIVIIDADNDIEARRSDVLSWKAENALEFELFLLPNNQDAGALEDLLENIINPNRFNLISQDVPPHLLQLLPRKPKFMVILKRCLENQKVRKS